MAITVKIKRLVEDIPLPSYSYEADAAFDLLAREAVTLKPGEFTKVPTGVSLELPEGYCSFVWDKSSIGINHGIKTLGGVVDAGYRGEYMIGVINLSNKAFTFEKGQKVAQVAIQKVEHAHFEEVTELSDSHRGEKGFGSAGK